MTEYVCYSCGVKIKLSRFLKREEFDGVPTTDECPVCGNPDELEYL